MADTPDIPSGRVSEAAGAAWLANALLLATRGTMEQFEAWYEDQETRDEDEERRCQFLVLHDLLVIQWIVLVRHLGSSPAWPDHGAAFCGKVKHSMMAKLIEVCGVQRENLERLWLKAEDLYADVETPRMDEVFLGRVERWSGYQDIFPLQTGIGFYESPVLGTLLAKVQWECQ